MPVPDPCAERFLARLLEMFVISIVDTLAKNKRVCKPLIPHLHARQAVETARGNMAALSVPSLASEVGAGRAAGVGDSCGPTPALPLYGDVHRWRIAFNCGCQNPQRAHEASALPIRTSRALRGAKFFTPPQNFPTS